MIQLTPGSTPLFDADAERRPVAAGAYRASVLHGPRAALRLLSLFGRREWPGFTSPPDIGAAALSIFVGAW